MASLERITIYPIKSLDGVDVLESSITAGGSLEWDRRFALCDAKGQWINGKRTAKVHGIRTRFDLTNGLVAMTFPRSPEEVFSLPRDLFSLSQRLTEYFGEQVCLVENASGGFPDDTLAPGPTVISRGTLREVASWFPGLAADDIHGRFRPNLVVDGDEPFWEDRLYPAQGTSGFRIGAVEFRAHNPCQRCVVPTRSPQSGEPWPRFTKIFTNERERTLPAAVARERFDHFYRLAVNTSIMATSVGRMLHIGDGVREGDW